MSVVKIITFTSLIQILLADFLEQYNTRWINCIIMKDITSYVSAVQQLKWENHTCSFYEYQEISDLNIIQIVVTNVRFYNMSTIQSGENITFNVNFKFVEFQMDQEIRLLNGQIKTDTIQAKLLGVRLNFTVRVFNNTLQFLKTDFSYAILRKLTNLCGSKQVFWEMRKLYYDGLKQKINDLILLTLKEQFLSDPYSESFIQIKKSQLLIKFVANSTIPPYEMDNKMQRFVETIDNITLNDRLQDLMISNVFGLELDLDSREYEQGQMILAALPNASSDSAIQGRIQPLIFETINNTIDEGKVTLFIPIQLAITEIPVDQNLTSENETVYSNETIDYGTFLISLKVTLTPTYQEKKTIFTATDVEVGIQQQAETTKEIASDGFVKTIIEFHITDRINQQLALMPLKNTQVKFIKNYAILIKEKESCKVPK